MSATAPPNVNTVELGAWVSQLEVYNSAFAAARDGQERALRFILGALVRSKLPTAASITLTVDTYARTDSMYPTPLIEAVLDQAGHDLTPTDEQTDDIHDLLVDYLAEYADAAELEFGTHQIDLPTT